MKSKNNGNNIYRMDGLGKVFRFTLAQTFKNKAYLFSYILMIAMMTFMPLISMISATSSEKAVVDSDILKSENEVTAIYLKNESGIKIDKNDILLSDTSFKDVPITFIEEEEAIPSLSETEIAVCFICEKDSDGKDSYRVLSVVSDDSKISAFLLDSFTDKIYREFELCRKSEFLNSDQLRLVNSGIDTGKTLTEADYMAKQEEKMPSSTVMIYSTVYSVIVMILVSLTVSYVITSVMEEKTSKLVENLLVSVRPLALVMGKVLAMMLYVVSMIVFGGIGAGISTTVFGMFFMDKSTVISEAAVAAETAGLSEASQSLNIGSFFGLGIGKLLILMLSLFLTYFMFSIISGILGSACTKAEEVGPTVMTINMLSMGGYIAALIVPNIDNPLLDKIFSIVPFISSYVGPISYVCGRTPIHIYLIGLALQIIFIVFLFRLCALVYRKLIVNDSKKLNIAEILKLSREGV